MRGFWEQDAPHEQRADLSTWLALPCATALDAFLVELANDLHAAASTGRVLPLRIRVANNQPSTGKGQHWFTVAYSIEPLELGGDVTEIGMTADSSVEDASDADSSTDGLTDASDADTMDGFISDDGSDWRGQVDWESANRAQSVGGMDLHHARIDAGVDPGASADDEAEDDVDMDDRPARRCRFLDDEAGDASDSADEQVRNLDPTAAQAKPALTDVCPSRPVQDDGLFGEPAMMDGL